MMRDANNALNYVGKRPLRISGYKLDYSIKMGSKGILCEWIQLVIKRV
jgi:hypothetical protein